jgi:hypothetical protein
MCQNDALGGVSCVYLSTPHASVLTRREMCRASCLEYSVLLDVTCVKAKTGADPGYQTQINQPIRVPLTNP